MQTGWRRPCRAAVGINERHRDDRLGNGIQRALRYGYRLSCIMFDLDLFKEINDSFGHDAGDRVQLAIARLARAACREADILARYGGEEFVLILPNTGSEAALGVAEKLREAVAGTRIDIGEGRAIDGTASFGVAQLPEGLAEGYDYGRLVSAADGALYAAKHAGRNRTVLAQATERQGRVLGLSAKWRASAFTTAGGPKPANGRHAGRYMNANAAPCYPPADLITC